MRKTARARARAAFAASQAANLINSRSNCRCRRALKKPPMILCAVLRERAYTARARAKREYVIRANVTRFSMLERSLFFCSLARSRELSGAPADRLYVGRHTRWMDGCCVLLRVSMRNGQKEAIATRATAMIMQQSVIHHRPRVDTRLSNRCAHTAPTAIATGDIAPASPLHFVDVRY